MDEKQFDRLERVLVEHGNQLGHNLVHLKKFLDGQRTAQEAFLAEQQAASDRLLQKSVNATRFAAAAAFLAAIAAFAPIVSKCL